MKVVMENLGILLVGNFAKFCAWWWCGDGGNVVVVVALHL